MTGDAVLEAALLDAAQQVAPSFGLDVDRVSILNRSENVVCKVTTKDATSVVMRLHRPGYNTIAELRSEVQWVQALADAAIPVPRAVPTLDGAHYALVDIDTGAGPIGHQVGVVEWVKGEPLGGPLATTDEDLSPHYERIGEIAAQIRAHSESWTPPAGFVRRRWDADAFVGEAPLWGRFWEAPAATNAQRSLLLRAREALAEELAAHPTTPDRFGLIHADLHLGNVMADGTDLTVIDFDDAGFGWFAYELAVSLHNALDTPWFEAARAAMLTGYRRFHRLSEQEDQLIDSLLTLRSLMIVGWLTDRPELPVHEHLDDVITDAVASATVYLDRRS